MPKLMYKEFSRIKLDQINELIKAVYKLNPIIDIFDLVFFSLRTEFLIFDLYFLKR